MMRIFSISFLLLLFSLPSFSQQNNFWSEISETQMRLSDESYREIVPVKYQTFALDLGSMKKVLANAPMEYTEAAKTNAVKLEMPIPGGGFEQFEIWETSVMQPKLAAKYSFIRTFTGKNHETGNLIALDYGAAGFHASIMTPNATYYIDPYASKQEENYIFYNIKDDLDNWGNPEKTKCGYNAVQAAEDYGNGYSNVPNNTVQARTTQGGELVNLRTLILAIACTGEYGRSRGGTDTLVMSAYNTTLSRLNQIWVIELATKAILHEDVERTIFLDPATDPFTDGELGFSCLGENPGVLNNRIDVETFDIGQCFTARCTDGIAGVAAGTNACTPRKSGGVTCHFGAGPNIGTMAHEMGHQCSVSHSWDNCPSSQAQRATRTAFEPGSGTTIMSYSGSCQDQNTGAEDDYYHNGSLEQFYNYIHDQNGETCGITTQPGNHCPEINWTYKDGFSIPKSTPFELIGDATDEDGDKVFYCWEQHDALSIETAIGFPQGDCPMWRTYAPNENPLRSFPITRYVLNPNAPTRPAIEILPDYEREFTFALTVRDQNPTAGGVTWEQLKFKVDGDAGPFRITSQADATTEWTVGKEVEIRWDPAGTNESPVNCGSVDLWLSISNGNFFSDKILENTPNDGYEKIFVPDNVTTRARLKMKCSDNIFFNVNDVNFTIKEATEPGFTAQVSPGYYYACLPDDTNISIETGSILSYAEELNVEIASPIPTGMTATFDKSKLAPGENANLNLSMTNDLGSGSTTLEVIIYGTGTDTVRRDVVLEYFRNDFSTVKKLGPVDGIAGVEELPTLTWTSSRDAQTFDLQIATNPAFKSGQILYEEFGMTDTFYLIPTLLTENTPYYWRIRPANQCGAGDYLTASSFHTVAKKCQSLVGLEGEQSRIPIPGNGFHTIQSSVSILNPGTINDVNIPNIRGSYEPLKSIRISLISPDSTRAILFERRCNGAVFNFGFDDAFSNQNPCPAADEKIRSPQESLSIFNGRELTGSWTIEVDVQQPGTGGGGSLEEWEFEFCADLALTAPTLMTNDTLPVQFGLGEQVSRDFLETIDDVDDQWTITYTVVTLPKFGELIRDGQTVKIGDQFNQRLINEGKLWYAHDGVSQDEFDNFTFTIRDSEGGWLATPQFNFKLNLNTVGVEDLNPQLEDEITIFPNPANNILNIQIDRILNETVNIQIFNAQGKLVKNQIVDSPNSIIKMNIDDLTSGFYFLSFVTEKGRATKSLVVKK